MFGETGEQEKISIRMVEGEDKCLSVYPSSLSLDYKRGDLKPRVLLYGTDWVPCTKNLSYLIAFSIFFWLLWWDF